MTIFHEVLKALQKVEEDTGRPATSIELTQKQFDELKASVPTIRTFSVASGLVSPPSINGVTIRVKK